MSASIQRKTVLLVFHETAACYCVDCVQDLIWLELQGAPSIPLTPFVGSDGVLLGNLHTAATALTGYHYPSENCFFLKYLQPTVHMSHYEWGLTYVTQ